MNGKVARALRKASQFNPNAAREYEVWRVPTRKYIMQLNPETNEIKYVLRDVESTIVECVTGSRKVYQNFKKFYNGFSEGEELRELPSKDQIKELESKIFNHNKHEQELSKTAHKTEETNNG